MKKKKAFYFLFLWGLFLLPLVSFAVAEPSYVGINEGDSYIWNTSFHKSPLEDYYIDKGHSLSSAENKTDWFFDLLDIDTDNYAWRVYITEIKHEKEYVYGGDEIDGVNYIYNFYEREVGEDWEIEKHNGRGSIMEYDENLYLSNTWWDMGFFPLWFTPTDMNWRGLVSELDDKYEKHIGDGEANTERSIYFFREIKCGMSTSWNPEYTSQMEVFESVTRYTREGVLMHYEWTYDGRIIMEIELEGAFIYENYWWIIPGIFIVIIVVIVPVIIVSIVIARKKRRGKIEKIAPPIVEKKPEVPSPAAVPPSIETTLKVIFCPMCGRKVKAGKNFCQDCGANLKE